MRGGAASGTNATMHVQLVAHENVTRSGGFQRARLALNWDASHSITPLRAMPRDCALILRSRAALQLVLRPKFVGARPRQQRISRSTFYQQMELMQRELASNKTCRCPQRQSSIAWTGVYPRRQWQRLLLPTPHTRPRPAHHRAAAVRRSVAPRPGRRRGSARQQQPLLHVCALSQVGAGAARDAPRAARQPVPQRPGHVQPDAAPLRRRADGRLGYTARLIALALLVAVQEKQCSPRAACVRSLVRARAMHLGCYYEPITHCTYRPD